MNDGVLLNNIDWMMRRVLSMDRIIKS